MLMVIINGIATGYDLIGNPPTALEAAAGAVKPGTEGDPSRFLHSSVAALAVYVSPVLLLFVVGALAAKPRLTDQEFFIVLVVAWFLLVRVGFSEVTPYYYFGRYLGSEVVPYTLVLAAVWLHSLLGDFRPRMRAIGAGIAALSLAWEAAAVAPQYRGGEMNRLDASLKPLVSRIQDRDLLLIADGNPLALRTALDYYYGKQTMLVDAARLKETIAWGLRRWADVYVVVARPDLAPGQYVGTLTLLRDSYAKTGYAGVLPISPVSDETRWYLYRVNRADLPATEQTPASDADRPVMGASNDPVGTQADMLRSLAEKGIDFTRATLPGYVRALRGFSHTEPDGRWTDGTVAEIRFAHALPERFYLELEVTDAYGPNRGKPVVVRVGGQQRQFTVGGGAKAVRLSFDLNAPVDAVAFDIPSPTSPLSRKESPDARELGMRVRSLRIVNKDG
jgi:hypothetical protein